MCIQSVVTQRRYLVLCRFYHIISKYDKHFSLKDGQLNALRWAPSKCCLGLRVISHAYHLTHKLNVFLVYSEPAPTGWEPGSAADTILVWPRVTVAIPASVSSSSLEEELSVKPLSISPSSCLSTSSSSLGTSFIAFLACRGDTVYKLTLTAHYLTSVNGVNGGKGPSFLIYSLWLVLLLISNVLNLILCSH